MLSFTSRTPSSRSEWLPAWASTKEQIAPGLLVPVIGNTYAGAAMIGLTATLDVAEPGDRILMVSFGSGAGSDAFDRRDRGLLEARRNLAPCTDRLHRPANGD